MWDVERCQLMEAESSTSYLEGENGEFLYLLEKATACLSGKDLRQIIFFYYPYLPLMRLLGNLVGISHSC